EDFIGRTATFLPSRTRLRPSPALLGRRADNPHRAALSPGYLQLAGREGLWIGHRSAIRPLLQDGLAFQVDHDHTAQTHWADAWPQLDAATLPKLNSRLLLWIRQRWID